LEKRICKKYNKEEFKKNNKILKIFQVCDGNRQVEQQERNLIGIQNNLSFSVVGKPNSLKLEISQYDFSVLNKNFELKQQNVNSDPNLFSPIRRESQLSTITSEKSFCNDHWKNFSMNENKLSFSSFTTSSLELENFIKNYDNIITRSIFEFKKIQSNFSMIEKLNFITSALIECANFYIMQNKDYEIMNIIYFNLIGMLSY
jgi:hypothetical protein